MLFCNCKQGDAMAETQNILLILLTVGGIALTIVLIAVLFRILNLLQHVMQDIRRLSDEAVPTLKQLQQVAERTDEALQVITDNKLAVAEAVGNLRKVTENIYRLENILQEQVEPTFVSIANRLSGFRKGIDTFFAAWRKNH
jgi:Na+-transporting methylmalonyl-CoA/oxaloacetate decarboxylase gamma subunit